MAVATAGGGGGYAARPSPSGLADVIDIILDKGLVIDAYVRVSLIGIEILTIDARIVIASVDTYLRFAEAVNRLDLQAADQSQGLPELMESITEGGASSKTKGAIEGAKEKLGLGGDDEDEDKDDKEKSTSRRRSSSSQRSRSRSRKSDDE
jgi:gas vesicle structural protein